MWNDLAIEIWAVAQLIPGEGIEDGVERVMEALETNLNRCFYCGEPTQTGDKGQTCPLCGGRPA